MLGLVVGVLVIAPLPAGASASNWAVVAHAQPVVGSGTLYGTACDAAECVAVGASPTAPYLTTTLAEIRTSSGWTRVPTPALQGSTSTSLFGVACPAVHDCIAVGTEHFARGGSTLVEHWDGTRWSVVPSVNGHGFFSELNGVWCGSASDCIAVGDSEAATLVEHWDGHTWRVQNSPSPIRDESNDSLLAVDCPGLQLCFAVGTEVTGGDDAAITFVEEWDGTRWSIVDTPSPSGGNFASLTSIACTSTSNCVAAGNANYRPIIERWNGTRWNIDLYPAADGSFGGVACSSASRCEVVGDQYGPAVAEGWDGHHWTAQPFPQGGQSAYAFGVTCNASGHCDAVGQGVFGPLAAQWNGTKWSSVAAEGVPTTASSTLASVSCPSSASCVAVGTLTTQGYGLVERYDGHAWTMDTGGAMAGELQSVSCATATSCMAVGVRYANNDASFMSEQWNGSRWTQRPIPTPAHSVYGAGLASVSCSTASDCMAVGSYSPPPRANNVPTTVAEHWNGSTWSIVAMPTAPNANLSAVSCAAPHACAAVGDRDDAPLVELWNGVHWTIATTPGLIGLHDDLLGVSCADANHCEAVGNAYRTSNDATALALVGNGTQWTVQPTSTTEARFRTVTALACRETNDCTAVGHDTTDTMGDEQPFTAHWDGTKWSLTAVLKGAAPILELNGIATAPSRDVAVGWSSSGLGQPQSNVIAIGG
jgi:hypothetical protein